MIEWLKCIGYAALIYIALGLAMSILTIIFISNPIAGGIGAFIAFIFTTISIKESRK